MSNHPLDLSLVALDPHAAIDRALRDLINRAGQIATESRRDRLDTILRRARSIGHTLDAARDCLDQLGADYHEAAYAYVRAGGRMLDKLDADLKAEQIPQLGNTTADDVLAWFEHFEIHLSPWQRRFLEGQLSA